MTLLRAISAAIVLALIAACDVMPADSFRDPGAPISATTRFDPAAFSGRWSIEAAFANDALAAPKGTLDFAYDPARERITHGGKTFTIPRPGVLVPNDPNAAKLVVMWVDADFRTAAIGTSDGTFGAIINRGAALSDDRLKAATEILEFYGWDTSKLIEVKT